MNRALLLWWSVLPGCVALTGREIQGMADDPDEPPAPAVPLDWRDQGTEIQWCQQKAYQPFMLFTLPSVTYPLRICRP
jgi:hypothetical protein